MKNKSNKTKLIVVGACALVLLAVAFITNKPGTSKDSETKKENASVEKVIDGDIVIPVNDITETAKFFPAQVNGIELEVLAVKASDGTVRTAFNTCQVCYSSGRGYYVQEGDVLVCQNCGNQFSVDEIEVSKNGCNPVPITKEYKTVSDSTITVSKDFLTEATVIFENWK